MDQAPGQYEEQRPRRAMAGGWVVGTALWSLIILVIGVLALVGTLGISHAPVPLDRDRVTGPEPVALQLARGALALLPGAPAVRPANIAHIAYVGLQSQRDTYTPDKGRLLDSFLAGMHALGYVEGHNLLVEWRWGDGSAASYNAILRELVDLPIDVIVLADSRARAEAVRVTGSIPLVTSIDGDLEERPDFGTLARPGSNLTGLSMYSTQLNGKRLELLQQAVSGLSRVGVLWNPEWPDHQRQMEALQAPAGALGIALVSAAAGTRDRTTPDEIQDALQAVAAERADGLLILPSPAATQQREAIARFAREHRLPWVAGHRRLSDAGALIAYGPDLFAMSERSAVFVDKMLRGVAPNEIPLERPSRFELILNFRTAAELGITFPRNLQLAATDVVR